MTLDPQSMLLWADAGDAVTAVEQRANAADLTLGPLSRWCKEMTVREMLRTRTAWRFNPVLCRIEDVVGAFAYERDGHVSQTMSTPREACGPELRQGLYAELDSVRRVQLRLMARGPETWLKLTAQDPGVVHTFMRSLSRDGLAPRSLWTELGSAWLGYTGAMRTVHARLVMARAQKADIDALESNEPTGAALAAGFVPEIKTWETLGPRDSLVLCDPWAVLAR